jgi:uncharacterized RDD family membrane protein YckC
MTPMSPSRRSPIFLGDRDCSLVSRFSAKAIDLIIVTALFLLGRTFWAPLGMLVGGAYCALQDGMGVGQSIGKRIIGLCVVDAGMSFPCSFKGSFMRNLPFLVAVIFSSSPFLWVFLVVGSVPFILLEAYLVISLPSGVRVGDILGNTRVMDYVDENLPEFSAG